MYRTSVPVTAESFFDREVEMAQLVVALSRLKSGAPRWLCLLGPRKVGKTSLLLELARRSRDPKVVFAVLDVFEEMPISLEIFRRYALRVIDGTLGAELGLSLEALAGRPSVYRAALLPSARFLALPAALKADVLELVDRPMDTHLLRACLELPERLAQALGLSVLVALDEFQELATSPASARQKDLLPLLRSIWQKHQRVAYVISGSAQTMLADLVTREHSPFFQHFALLKIGPFAPHQALRLLLESAPADRPLPRALCERAVEVLGGHPFYLQLLGDALTSVPPPYDDRSLKDALQDLLFSRTGRLSLYFENEHERLVGRSTFLAALLSALADGPLRLGEIAAAIHAPTGAAVGYVERLADAVVKGEDARYALADPVFALWLRWRKPGGTVVPMTLVGDLAEKAVAAHLAEMGFELVYQSRASRGAFDLLAIRGPYQLGLQVKRTRLPVRFSRAEWSRLEAEGKRLVTHWAIAVALPAPEGEVLFLDPKKARRTTRGVSLGAEAAIENTLLWMEERPAPRGKGARKGKNG